jgi:hypothetical protein
MKWGVRKEYEKKGRSAKSQSTTVHNKSSRPKSSTKPTEDKLLSDEWVKKASTLNKVPSKLPERLNKETYGRYFQELWDVRKDMEKARNKYEKVKGRYTQGRATLTDIKKAAAEKDKHLSKYTKLLNERYAEYGVEYVDLLLKDHEKTKQDAETAKALVGTAAVGTTVALGGLFVKSLLSGK